MMDEINEALNCLIQTAYRLSHGKQKKHVLEMSKRIDELNEDDYLDLAEYCSGGNRNDLLPLIDVCDTLGICVRFISEVGHNNTQVTEHDWMKEGF